MLVSKCIILYLALDKNYNAAFDLVLFYLSSCSVHHLANFIYKEGNVFIVSEIHCYNKARWYILIPVNKVSSIDFSLAFETAESHIFSRIKFIETQVQGLKGPLHLLVYLNGI